MNGYCPQCGYDLRGQTNNYCPECGFHYDEPGLRTMSWAAFYDSLVPCLRAAKLLAPAGLLAVGAALGPPWGLIIFIPLLLSRGLVERWILGSSRQGSYDWGWLSHTHPAAWHPALVVANAIILTPAGVWIAGVIAIIGLALAAQGLLNGRSSSLQWLTPGQAAILSRAQTATAALGVFNLCSLLGLLGSVL